jgi:hypothetical protein
MEHVEQTATSRGRARRPAHRPLIAAAVISALALATVVAGAIGGGAGAFANSSKAGSGQVRLSETVGSATCFSAPSSGSCRSIDDLGGVMDRAPGAAATETTVTITNTGSVATSQAALTAGACAATPARDDDSFTGADTAGYCGQVDVTIANATPGSLDKCVFPVASANACAAPSSVGTLASLADQRLASPALSTLGSDASATYVITVGLATTATNADQGLTAAMPLTWAISQ